MKLHRVFSKLFIAATIIFATGQLNGDEIHVAVASNFAGAITTIAERFEASSGHNVILSFGSTGKHYAQIKNGAPYDVFFAADIHRPDLLEKEGVGLPGSRFTYAIGNLVLWSPKKDYVDPEGNVLQHGEFRFLAIANPRLAPYGNAAVEVLQELKLLDKLSQKIVRGENISQAFQYVKSGNAELGFIACSQLKNANRPIEGSFWEVSQELYTPIEQQAILLKESEAARAFLTFVRTDEAIKVIHDYGYDTP